MIDEPCAAPLAGAAHRAMGDAVAVTAQHATATTRKGGNTQCKILGQSDTLAGLLRCSR
jgi:hypothetical protein